MHQFIPILSCWAPKQCDNCISNSIEVCFLTDEFLVNTASEKIDAQSRKDEKQQEQQSDEIADLRNDVHYRVKDDFDAWLWSD